ncbi:unnamed protein product [Nesidiocoris tenuis]|uniref:RNA-directed DNA polymerase n=1 Tax=Nesidiocoris tenuis TaxID=355587 RepID=A0A6H5FYY5_9HEMI|nr:unnamed protein product [Nesidiocoris tenuis]
MSFVSFVSFVSFMSFIVSLSLGFIVCLTSSLTMSIHKNHHPATSGMPNRLFVCVVYNGLKNDFSVPCPNQVPSHGPIDNVMWPWDRRFNAQGEDLKASRRQHVTSLSIRGPGSEIGTVSVIKDIREFLEIRILISLKISQNQTALVQKFTYQNMEAFSRQEGTWAISSTETNYWRIFLKKLIPACFEICLTNFKICINVPTAIPKIAFPTPTGNHISQWHNPQEAAFSTKKFEMPKIMKESETWVSNKRKAKCPMKLITRRMTTTNTINTSINFTPNRTSSGTSIFSSGRETFLPSLGSCESKSYEHLTTVLRNHLSPQPLIIPSRHAFLNRKQREGECVSMYMSELRRLAVNYQVGAIKKFTCTLQLKEGATPIYQKARPVPLALRGRIENELQRLVEAGVLEPVETSDWATPVVPVVKPSGDIRLCGDYSGTVNRQVAVTQHPFPGFEEAFSKLSGGQLFTRLDVRSAFLHVPVSKETSHVLTINTHCGLFRPQRLMYGVSPAPAVWQRYIDSLFKPIKCCFVHDDVIITGKDDHEHLQNLEKVLQVCKENDLHLNLSKCKFFQKSVTFLGYKVDAAGVHKTEDKVNAVLKANTPSSVTDVKSFLGLVTFYARFVPNLATMAQPLYNLTRKGTAFVWDAACRKSFEKIKAELASERFLAHYDPSLPIVIATDASNVGLGAVISHIVNGMERPIAYASRTLTKAETNYSVIDREALGIKWGIFKFFQYLYGRRFTLYTDHKPLVHIFGSKSKLPLLSATRMLHYALQLQIFDFDVKYRKSEQHTNADALSRLPLTSQACQSGLADEAEIFYIQQLQTTAPLTAKKIADATMQDPELREILQNLRLGTSMGDGDYKYSTYQNCIFYGIRVYIPSCYRNMILSELHEGHIGIVKMKALARSHVYWPRIDIDIERMVKNCRACQLGAKEPAKVPTHFWERPCHPWQRIHLDFAGPFQNVTYFLVIDAYSKWPEVFPVKNTSSTTTIHILSELFARFGLPVCAVSDNASTFTSKDFQQYMAKNGIRHITGAPYHPSTNGQVERYVQTLKKALKALADSPGTPAEKLCTFLMTYRRAPHSSTGQSPSKMMLNREIRSALDILRPTVKSSPPVQEVKQKAFVPGEKVALRAYTSPNRKWEFGKVLNRDGDLTYSLIVDGAVKRRHVDQMRSVGQNLELAPPTYGTIPTPSQAPTSPRHSVAPGGASLGGGQEPISSPVLTDGPPSSGPLPRLPSSGNTSGGLPEPPAGETLRKSSSARPAGLRRYPQRVRKIPQRLNL